MKIGPYQVSALVLDRFRLDGGAMFGAVPKNLWNKRIPGDDQNRIQLACRALVLQSSDRLILVDVGCGTKWDEKQKDIYSFESQGHIQKLAGSNKVTDIILTHLHFDHAGGVTHLDQSGKPTLSFPAATVYIQEKNWERAQNPGPREKATYLSSHIEPLKKAKLSLTKDAQEIFPEIKVFQVNGHTDGLQWVQIGKGSDAIVYPADLIPTAHHLPVPYVMGYDLCASTTMKEKAAFLEQAEREGWWIAFEHDAETALVKVGRDQRGTFIATETTSLPQYAF